MNIKKILFIDDEDVTQVAGKLERNLKKHGIHIQCDIFKIQHLNFSHKDPQGKTSLDFQKIKETLINNYMDNHFDVVACDYYFKDEKINGYKLTRWLKNESSRGKNKKRIRRALFTLYSSEKEKYIEETLKAEDISAIIRLKLGDFFDRDKLADDLANLVIDNSNSINLSDKLISELERYPNLRFKSVYPIFKGKTIGEISQEIENETHHGIKFQEALIEQTIAHMIDLNI